LALLIGGVVVTESVFSIPGLGRLTVDAVLARDYPTVQAVILLFSVVYVLINLVVDLSYTFLDPRIRIEGVTAEPIASLVLEPVAERPGAVRRMARNRSVVFGGVILALVVLMAVLAPVLGHDGSGPRGAGAPQPASGRGDQRAETRTAARRPARTGWERTARPGRLQRVIYGARVSLLVGVSVALISTAIGLVIGMFAGYVRWLDEIVMRVMDGLMSIPAILFGHRAVSLSRAGLRTVIVAIVIPEVPRVVRLVRSVVLSIREEPYVEAAVALGARTPALLARHVLPTRWPR